MSSEAALGWSSKQGRVLTGGGVAEKLYDPARGFPYDEKELPHYHLVRNEDQAVFRQWRSAGCVAPSVCGVWNRPLFIGGMEHTSDATEVVYNTQTPSIFIDLRIPRTRPESLAYHRSLSSIANEDLRLFARQHCFSGYSLAAGQPNSVEDPLVVTRHHVIDWNFVGAMRTRPNKWRVEMAESGDVWKEWSFATDDFGQSYYMERWERRPGDDRGAGRCLALRCTGAESNSNTGNGLSSAAAQSSDDDPRDKILLVVGDHFSFARGRPASAAAHLKKLGSAPGGSTVEAVDKALAKGDRATAEAILTVEGGHGCITSSGAWMVDTATHPWQEGQPLAELLGGASPHVCPQGNRGAGRGPGFLSWTVVLGGAIWDVLECSDESPEALQAFLSRSYEAAMDSLSLKSRI